jgi:hypothetical protein
MKCTNEINKELERGSHTTKKVYWKRENTRKSISLEGKTMFWSSSSFERPMEKIFAQSSYTGFPINIALDKLMEFGNSMENFYISLMTVWKIGWCLQFWNYMNKILRREKDRKKKFNCY